MSSSSMRKLGQKATHKERSQPLERQKLGLLEKHKDYSLRAKDFNKKKAYLKTLRQKAAERNEDEFYHKMLSRRGPGSAITRGKGAFTGTVQGDRGNRALSVDVVRLLKTQDLGYLRTMRNVLAKDVVELEESVAIAASFAGVRDVDLAADDESEDDDISGSRNKRRKPNKIVFSTDAEERDTVMGMDDNDGPGAAPPEADDSDDEFGGFDDDNNDGEEKEDGDSSSKRTEADAQAEKLAKLRRKLSNAKRRLRAVSDAENELELQRARMAKTATIGGVTKSGKKIKIRERKR